MSKRPIRKQDRNQTHHVVNLNLNGGYETKVKIERNSFTDTPDNWSQKYHSMAYGVWCQDCNKHATDLPEWMSLWHSEYLDNWKAYQDIN